jgi:predicted nucleic acid-binding protein
MTGPAEAAGGGHVVLVDTSVWVEVFRKPSRLTLASVADLEEVVTCLPVVQEVLQGFRHERAFGIARGAMFALPIVESPLRSEVFEDAVRLYRAARRAGLTVRSGVDCLIAACALRHGLTVAHHDRDFEAIAEVSPLQVRNVLV